MIANKKQRNELSYDLKKQIYEYYHSNRKENPKFTQAQVIQHFRQFGLELPKSTLGDILKNKAIGQIKDEDGLASKFRSRTCRHPDLENCLYLWFSQMSETNDHPPTNELLIEKAKVFGQMLGIENFSYSAGWIDNFKARHLIKKRIRQAHEPGSEDLDLVVKFNQLQDITKDYPPSEVFSLRWLSLGYNLTPNQTLVDCNDTLVVGLCVNADGSEKIKPIIIYKIKRPKCFGQTFNPNSLAFYYHNSTARMNSFIFINWLKEFNKKMRVEKRNVLLLIDSCASHAITNEDEEELGNVRVEYLPPNTTSSFQPLDEGVTKIFKTNYRAMLVNKIAHQIEDHNEYTMPDVREAICLIKRAWDLVSKETIQYYWDRVKIVSNIYYQQDSIIDVESEQRKEVEGIWRQLNKINTFGELSIESVNSFIEFDNHVPTSEMLTDKQIVDQVKLVEYTEDEASQSKVGKTGTIEAIKTSEPIDRHTVQSSLKTIFKYFEENEALDDESLELLETLQSRLDDIVANRIVSPKKRERRELDLATKKQIHEYYNSNKENPKFTQSQVIRHFEPILGYTIARSTISDILKNKSIANIEHQNDLSGVFRYRTFANNSEQEQDLDLELENETSALDNELEAINEAIALDNELPDSLESSSNGNEYHEPEEKVQIVPGIKMKRKGLSYAIKRQIYEYYNSHKHTPKFNKTKVIQYFRPILGYALAKSTLCDILKNKAVANVEGEARLSKFRNRASRFNLMKTAAKKIHIFPRKKIARKGLSLGIKKQIQEYYNNNKDDPKFTQSKIVTHFIPIIGYAIPRSTLSDILKNKAIANVEDETRLSKLRNRKKKVRLNDILTAQTSLGIKKRRKDLNLAIKKQMHEYYNDNKANPKFKQTDVIRHFSQILGYHIPRSTVSDILKNKAIAAVKDENDLSGVFRKRVAFKNPGLENEAMALDSELPDSLQSSLNDGGPKKKVQIASEKKERKSLSLAIKKQIHEYYNNNKSDPKFTQSQIIKHFEPILGYTLPRSTLSDILKNKAIASMEDKNEPLESQPANRYPELENWFTNNIDSFSSIIGFELADSHNDTSINDTSINDAFNENLGIEKSSTDSYLKLPCCPS